MTPKTLLLVDSFGALFSAFLLGAVLVRFESFFGMPAQALYILASFPVVFMLYDIICIFTQKESMMSAIKIIAISNLAYCLISIGFVILHFSSLTTLGLAYFLIEIMVVLVLASVELRFVRR